MAFFDAAYGCESLGEALTLYYTKLVKSEMISMSELLKLTVRNPAKTVGLDAGIFEVGQKVNAVLFDQNETIKVNNEQSLYNNETLSGKVMMSFSGERITRF